MTETIGSAVSCGDIVRTKWPVRMKEHLNLYLGSGRAGACFDVWGLMHSGPKEVQSQARTFLSHADHWHRGKYGLDYWLPVARLKWAGDEPPEPKQYRQELRIYDGRLETNLVWADLSLTTRIWFHPERRDLLAVEIEYEAGAEGEMPSLLLAPEVDVNAHYDQHLVGSFETLQDGSADWVGRLTVGTAASMLALRVISGDGEARLETTEAGLTIRFPATRGRHLFVIGTASPERCEQLIKDMKAVPSADDYASEAAEAWHRRWGDAFIHVPVVELQALWARSLYYTLCSHAPEVRTPAGPMGWSGNGWPFHFPQEVSYVHPALLRLGHLDIAQSWVEFYRSYLEETKKVTKRIYKSDGAMWAWEHPIGTDTEMLSDGTPNWFQYEIHNAAYPLRMAYETSLYLGDDRWTREVAWPIIYESARFYGSNLKRESDGKWSLHVIPSMSQDEHCEEDAKNYLCALYSARYSLTVVTQLARQLGLEGEELSRWRQILSDGLAFRRLYLENPGIYSSCEGLGAQEILGKEKHPVQLNPLTFVPLDQPDEVVARAYEQRYSLCVRSNQNYFPGWTLSAFWLASSHIGDSEGLLEGLSRAVPACYVDPNHVQIYESSGGIPYYVTSHGLYMQALNDALVSCYWDGVQIGKACPPSWNEVTFRNLRVPSGLLSGERDGREWKVREV